MNIPVEDFPLPALREDIRLYDGITSVDGSPSWSIYDAVRNKYFKIGWPAFELITRWSAGTVNKILKRVKEETVCNISEKDVLDFIEFLYMNSLTNNTVSGDYQDYYMQYKLSQKSWFLWLIQNYLFIKIPLIKPRNFLDKTIKKNSFIFTKGFFYLMMAMGAIGLYLVARQWDVFVHTFIGFFSSQGLVYYISAVVIIKVLHELGHAYAATRYGCKVNTIGVAFIVMFPVLYTDTTDAWKLTSRKKRMVISTAGMITEIYIACIATFLWCFLPDGIIKNIAFVVATTSWVMSLLVNLNPFMRFDGYYILSDLWGIDNLQARSFAFGRWKLREILFGLGEPKPEKISDENTVKLYIYAWLIWIYRFFLFIGIALLVYYFFFKLLGVFLFIIEILWFIAIPLIKEMLVWWNMKAKIFQSTRVYITASILCFSLFVLFYPWNSTIRLPGIYESSENHTVYAPVRAMISEVHVAPGELIEKNQLLISLESQVLEQELKKIDNQINQNNLKINRLAANNEYRENISVLLSQQEELITRKNGILRELDLLEVRSPITGTIIYQHENIHPGRWINQSKALFNIINDSEFIVVGILSESDISRVEEQQQAIFLPENPELEKIELTLYEVETANLKSIDIPYFLQKYGGDIVTYNNTNMQEVPEKALYKIRFQPQEGLSDHQYVVRGTIHLYGTKRSIFRRISDSVGSVLVREMGF